MLYFDWYAETDYLKNHIWQLKDTQEIICIREEIVDINTGCIVNISVVEADIEIDALGSDEQTDRQAEIKGVNVDWRYTVNKASANFEYEGYKYYLRVKEPFEENYILTLVEELLS